MTIEFSIVGLSSYIYREKLNDFYGSAPGKDVIIKLEPGNVFDPRAVVTLLDGRTIGHVRKADINDYGLFTFLMKEKRQTYAAKILRKSENYDSLVARLECDHTFCPEVDLQKLHNGWHYSGLVLELIPEWKELENVMDSVMTLLEHKTASVENLQPLMERYLELVRYGFSKEFFEDRKKLYLTLKSHEDEGVRSFAKALENVSAEVHDNNVHSRAYSHIIKQMKKQIAKEHATEALNYALLDLNAELTRFPSKLYEQRKKAQYFATRLYYEQIPREVLLKFMSGIALCGYLGEIEKKGIAKPKKKRGAPKKTKDKYDLRKRVVVGKHRDYWVKHIRENLEGKDNARAGYVMRAYVVCSVLDSAPYAEVKSTFGNIGTEEYYNKGFNNVETEYSGQFSYLCQQIEADKKKLLAS